MVQNESINSLKSGIYRELLECIETFDLVFERHLHKEFIEKSRCLNILHK